MIVGWLRIGPPLSQSERQDTAEPSRKQDMWLDNNLAFEDMARLSGNCDGLRSV